MNFDEQDLALLSEHRSQPPFGAVNDLADLQRRT